MSVMNVLVEGKDDIAFFLRLVEVMRAERGLADLRWRLVSRENKMTIGGTRKRTFGDSFVTVGPDVVAITETCGVYQKPGPDLLSIKTPEDKKVDQICGFFDADAPQNFLGHDVKSGGLRERRPYVEGLYSSLSIGRKFFFFPDDGRNGTLEDLVISLIRPEIRFVIDREWPEYRKRVSDGVKQAGRAYLNYSAKCALSQFATIFDEDVAKDLYWVAALWNDSIWDWSASAIMPLRRYVAANLPVLLRQEHEEP